MAALKSVLLAFCGSKNGVEPCSSAASDAAISIAGMYIRPVFGLKAMGSQLWPPEGLGHISKVVPFGYRDAGFSTGRPVVRSILLAQFTFT